MKCKKQRLEIILISDSLRLVDFLFSLCHAEKKLQKKKYIQILVLILKRKDVEETSPDYSKSNKRTKE